MNLKREIRILGIDDGPYSKSRDKKTILIGTVFRGGDWIDGVLKTEVKVDGMDSTKKIIKQVSHSRHYEQLQYLILDGITFGGLNVVDIEKLYDKLKLPVLVVSRKHPNFNKFKKALEHVSNTKKRWNKIKKAGKPIEVDTTQNNKEKPIYVQYKGLNKQTAKEVVKLSSTRSRIPEPIRVSHLIATGVIKGESYGNA
ncbi:MAG: Endonuclease V-like [Candidatus Methanohalarchaeum thermophilum]|uniref:UPF0215 protein BTN85_1721 n=1 Tax=Methanohalarchaeum thermophilum TaxID=1903181 RepID=A0A1Q6DXX7_METT1|nr:MAG: Endonuclease V-like [Candidatus Methanohalarchaeum thermophilum]